MGSTIGKNIKVSLFGESHGQAIGLVCDGLKAGIPIDMDFMNHQMELRKANDLLSTPRKEADEVNFLSGVYNGHTTGSPLCLVIENTNVHSSDYPKMYRPSHADYVADIKYGGFQDYRGGGHFSGRITAPLVALGSIAIKVLEKQGVKIGSHITQIYNVKDDSKVSLDTYFDKVNNEVFPVLDETKKALMMKAIEDAKKEQDSVGGIVESIVLAPVGIGEPFFNSLESVLSQYIFSCPGVKGIEFGIGFEFASLKGSEANDSFKNENGKIVTTTNNNGGINGGISNGMPIIIKTVLKPTPSIGKVQETINDDMQNDQLVIKGRHDPCIVRRARVVLDSLIALAVLDLMCDSKANDWMK